MWAASLEASLSRGGHLKHTVDGILIPASRVPFLAPPPFLSRPLILAEILFDGKARLFAGIPHCTVGEIRRDVLVHAVFVQAAEVFVGRWFGYYTIEKVAMHERTALSHAFLVLIIVPEDVNAWMIFSRDEGPDHVSNLPGKIGKIRHCW